MGVAPKASGSKLFDALDKTFAEDHRGTSPNGGGDTDTDEDANATKGGAILNDYFEKKYHGPARRDRSEQLDELRAAQEMQQAAQDNGEETCRRVVCDTQRYDSIGACRGADGACGRRRFSSEL